MATKNFTEFNTASPLTTSDYIVGYNAAGTAEIKTQVQNIINLVSDSDAQTLSFNEGNKSLLISSGNTVSLSAFVEEAPQDGIIYSRKDANWFDITAPGNLQVRRGTVQQVSAITPLEGEPIWETNTKKLKIGDGTTLGGIEIGPRVFTATESVETSINTSTTINLSSARNFIRQYTTSNSNVSADINLPHINNQPGDEFQIEINIRLFASNSRIRLRAPSVISGGTVLSHSNLGDVISAGREITKSFIVRNVLGTPTGWALVQPSLTVKNPLTINNATDMQSLSANFNTLLGELRRLGVIG